MRLHDHARLWRIAGPAMAANCSAAGIGLVDTWAIGHLPDPVLLGAVGLGAFLTNFVYWGCGFLRMGTTGQVAQAHGAQDRDRIAAIVIRAIGLGLVLGLALTLLRGPLIHGALLYFQAAPELSAAAQQYTDIRLLAVSAVLIKLAMTGFLIGTGRAGWALSLEVTVNSLNAGFTIWFVVGLDGGLVGAAWASVLAEGIAALLGAALLISLLGGHVLKRAIRQPDLWRPSSMMKSLGGDTLLLLRTLILLSAFAIFWRQSAQLGTMVAGTNQVLLQFITLAALALDGIAYAAEGEVGRAVGRSDRALYDRMVRLTLFWSLLFAGLTSLIYGLGGPALVALFTDHETVRAGALPLLPLAALLPLIAVWSYALDGIFVGLTAYGPMALTMAVALCLYLLALHWMGTDSNLRLWLVFTGFMGLRGLAQACALPYLRRRAFPS